MSVKEPTYGKTVIMPRLCHISKRSQGHFLVLVVVLMVTAGCAEDPTPTPTPPRPPLSAVEVLERSRDAMTAVASYKFAADRTMYEDGRVYPSQISFQWVNPDSHWVRIEGVGRTRDYWGESIVVGDRGASRSSDRLEGTWRESELPPAPGFRDPGWAFAELKQAELHDDADIDGRPVYHVTAFRDSGIRDSPPVRYDLYIDKEDLQVRRLIMEGTFPGDHSDTITTNTTYDFYDYNVPIIIELPEINE